MLKGDCETCSRFDDCPHLSLVKALIDADKLGEVLTFGCVSYQPRVQ